MGQAIKKTILMITLNEAHNLHGVFNNLRGWADNIIVVDSKSSDGTQQICEHHGAKVVEREFDGFGNQWNFAISLLPNDSDWVMKLDPDERLSDALKAEIDRSIVDPGICGLRVKRRLWFLGRPLPVVQKIDRLWRHGKCKFTSVKVNEYPIIEGNVVEIDGFLEHHDSPNLEHWLEKQNRYSSAEALVHIDNNYAASPKFFGTKLERRMYLKKFFYFLPFRYILFFFYNFVYLGSFKAGYPGWVWARLRSDIMRLVEYKIYEKKYSKNEGSS